jgi:hypothetical protein
MIASLLKQENKAATESPPKRQQPHSDNGRLHPILKPTGASRQDLIRNMALHQTQGNDLKNEGHSAPQNIETRMKRSPPTTHVTITHSQPQDWMVKIVRRRMERIATP